MARKPFVVLDAEILSSSVWSEAAHVRLVWITLLILCDTEGNVGAAVPGIARAAGVSLDEAVDAIERLQQPDPHSRTKSNEGRRLELSERGFRVLNFMEHLDRLSSERLRARERVRMHRKRRSDKKNLRSTVTQTNSNVTVRPGNREKGIGNREQTDNGALPLSPSQVSVTDYELEPCSSDKGKREPVPMGQRVEYAEEVLKAFRGRAEKPTYQFNGLDGYWLKRWMDEGIPLRVVLAGIALPRNVGHALAYYNSAVVEEHERVTLALSGTR